MPGLEPRTFRLSDERDTNFATRAFSCVWPHVLVAASLPISTHSFLPFLPKIMAISDLSKVDSWHSKEDTSVYIFDFIQACILFIFDSCFPFSFLEVVYLSLILALCAQEWRIFSDSLMCLVWWSCYSEVRVFAHIWSMIFPNLAGDRNFIPFSFRPVRMCGTSMCRKQHPKAHGIRHDDSQVFLVKNHRGIQYFYFGVLGFCSWLKTG